jgi:hypothetical protein
MYGRGCINKHDVVFPSDSYCLRRVPCKYLLLPTAAASFREAGGAAGEREVQRTQERCTAGTSLKTDDDWAAAVAHTLEQNTTENQGGKTRRLL